MVSHLHIQAGLQHLALVSWLGMFCACIALVTVWVMPLSVPIQILATALFAPVPVGILIYWFGGFHGASPPYRSD
jgi:hypothetical protein